MPSFISGYAEHAGGLGLPPSQPCPDESESDATRMSLLLAGSLLEPGKVHSFCCCVAPVQARESDRGWAEWKPGQPVTSEEYDVISAEKGC